MSAPSYGLGAPSVAIVAYGFGGGGAMVASVVYSRRAVRISTLQRSAAICAALFPAYRLSPARSSMRARHDRDVSPPELSVTGATAQLSPRPARQHSQAVVAAQRLAGTSAARRTGSERYATLVTMERANDGCSSRPAVHIRRAGGDG